MSVQEIVHRCEQLFEDLNFGAVKEWKAAVPGRKAIGYMPVYVPHEIIHAAGMLPVGIFGGGDQIEVIQGDAYYLQDSALDRRAGTDGAPGLPGRDALPVHL